MCEEDVQQVAWRLGVDLLLVQVDVGHFDGLGGGQAEHLLRQDAALEDVREDVPGTGDQLVTWRTREGVQLMGHTHTSATTAW